MLQELSSPRPDGLQTSVERALASGVGADAWPADLRARFIAQNRQKARRDLPLQLNTGFAVAIAAGLFNFLAVPQFGWLGLVLPGAVALLLTTIAHVMLRKDRIGIAKAITALSVICFASISMHIASHADPVQGVRYAMAIVILLPMSMHGLPFTMREKTRFALAFMVVTTLAGSFPHGFPPQSMMLHLIILSITGFGSWMMIRQIHTLQARGFLHELKREVDRLELEQRNDLLRELSESDPLTGLPNRRSFERVFSETYLSGEVSRFAVMMVDIDHFKGFNDQYGHQAGDRCLVMVARELSRCVARYDGHVARFGGEEFVVLLRDDAVSQPCDVAHEMLDSVRALRVNVGGGEIREITASIGVAKGSPKTGMNRMIRYADEALYVAKEMGRNRVEMHRPKREVA